MDPLSALAVATSLVQFLDFTSKLVSSTYTIYKSSRDGDVHDDIENITKDLRRLNDRLAIARPPAATPSTATQDQELNTLCQDCNQVADRLLSALNALGAQNQRGLWGSFKQALKTIWSQDEIEKLQKQLDSFRQQVSMHILVSLREQVAAVQINSSRTQDQTGSILQSTRDLSQRLLEHIDQNDKMQADIINAISGNYMRGPVGTSDRLPANTMLQFLTVEDEARLRRRLLHKLQFREIYNRYDAIPEAHEKTFQWIFHEASSGHKWTDFTDWLRSSESVYWVTGKPGAGKSTLMKFIFDEPRMDLLLGEWSQGRKLIKSSFYFWNSGRQIQMSQIGLVRTLLYDVLQKLPDLIPHVFPHLLETWMIFGKYINSNDEWTWPELRHALQRLVQVLNSSPSIRTVFFIDGLDEFQGEPSGMIDFIQSLLGPNIKICVSSRPWTVFEDTFSNRPSLRIEDLTRADIKIYVESKFSANPGFEALRKCEPHGTTKLTTGIIDKASGVFLWVHLVTTSLLLGLSDGERLSDLQTRLDSLPTDLENLFWKMLDSIDPSKFERASQLFQIVRATEQPLTLLEFSFADDDDTEAALKFPSGGLTSDEETARAEMMRRRLNACCKGMLEPQGVSGKPLASAPVGYLHRTVKDFLRDEDNWNRLLTATKDSFVPYLGLCNVYIMNLKKFTWTGVPAYTGDRDVEQDVMLAIECARLAFPKGSDLQFRLLDEVDKTVHLIFVGEGPLCYRDIAQYPHQYFHLPTQSANSLLEYATYLRLGPYVGHCLARLSDTSTINPTKVLYLAAGYGGTALEDSFKPLLRLGADPNAVFPGEQGKTTWQIYADSLPTRQRKCSDVARAFLDHGADPHAVDAGVFDGDIYQLLQKKKRQTRFSHYTTRLLPRHFLRKLKSNVH